MAGHAPVRLPVLLLTKRAEIVVKGPPPRFDRAVILTGSLLSKHRKVLLRLALLASAFLPIDFVLKLDVLFVYNLNMLQADSFKLRTLFRA